MLKEATYLMGKWHKKRYKILKEIGQGAMATVYKVQDHEGDIKAMKISKDLATITREYDMLKKLHHLRTVPVVYEMDDCKVGQGTYFFIVMDYIHGRNLKYIMKHKKIPISSILGIGIILADLVEEIFKKGYVYGDIKLENILYDEQRQKFLFVDFGGVVEKGFSLKEYTPTYDLMSWQRNRHGHEEAPLIFGVAMIMTSLLLGKEFSPLTNHIEDIIYKIDNLTLDIMTKDVVKKGLKQRYSNLLEFKGALEKVMKNGPKRELSNKSLSIVIDFIFYGSVGVFIVTIMIGLNLWYGT